MKFSDLCPPPKLAVRRNTAVAQLEYGKMLERFEAIGWIRPLPPVEPGQQFDLFSVEELQNCLRRLSREGWPASLKAA